MRPAGIRFLLLAALLLACGRQPPPGSTTPLVDGLHAPLVLTESALLDMPPADSGNRFLSGWWPDRRVGALRQVNVGDRATLEAVFLDGRERRISTRLEIRRAAPGATLGVNIAGIELPAQPLVPDLEILLPAGLPLGRLPIVLDLRGSQVLLHAIGFGHAWPPGEADPTPERVVQSGYSAIDFPRRLSGPATLLGRFEPPAEPEADQRFAVVVETDAGGSEVGFEWRGGRRRRAVPVEVELPRGFIRIRLLAQGLGPSGVWRDLRLVGGGPVETGERPTLSTAPGREGLVQVAASRRFRLVRAPGLGLADETEPSRDAEFLFDLRQEPGERRNLAGMRAIEVDWLRSRLAAWTERNGEP